LGREGRLKKSNSQHTAKGQGQVRIIAGVWRGRRLPVPDVAGLRPSGDRGRETLFNWLQPHLREARCADLFAGTGVLGLEAVSRGAASVVLVENSRLAAKSIRHSIETLNATGVSLVEGDALQWLEGQMADSFDLVFVDPPFGKGLAEQALRKLAGSDSLAPGALVYLESARAESLLPPGPGWELLRDKTLGEVRMQLFRKI
jgi:16S rRNA (guanine966-N2)-methyltransferase